MGKLYADLMRPSRFQGNISEGKPAAAAGDAVGKLRMLRAGRSRGNDARDIRPAVLQKLVRKHAAVRETARGHSVIPLGKGTVLHLRGQPRCRLGGAREHHHAARRTIEAVHKAQIDGSGLLIFFLDICLQKGEKIQIAR